MDVKNSLAMRKKRELLGSLSKRKMSLRKYIDNPKQNECRLDITQITKCVFLGSLCLKPVPQLFDSPILLEELDMKVGNVRIEVNDENLNNVESTVSVNETRSLNCARKANVKKKCLNPPKLKKKSLRDKSESNNSLNIVKNENIKLECSESQRSGDSGASLVEDTAQNVPNETRTEDFIFCKVMESPHDEPSERINLLPSDISLEDDNLELQLLNENHTSDDTEPDNISIDIKGVNSITPVYDIAGKRELTPELILIDSDDDAIDQLMYNIMDIKIGPNGFEEKFLDMPPSDIEEYEEYPNEYNTDKIASPPREGTPPKEEKNFKRRPQCKICCQVFSSYMKLKKHKLTHSGDKPYLCLKCEENHSTLDQLIAHLRTHEGKRPYVCKKCSKGFKTTKALANHQTVHVLKKVDPPKRVFKCEVCGKEFRKLCDLERHTRVHTGEKPSVCNICNRRFQQAHNLNKHLLIHTQEKPFQCDICNKKFGRSDVLNRHLLTHSVKKPNHCETCMKSFIRVSQLLAHKEKHHADQTS